MLQGYWAPHNINFIVLDISVWYFQKKTMYRLLELSFSVNVLRGCSNTDQENQNSILYHNHVMWNYTLSSPTAVTLQNASPEGSVSYVCPKTFFWKIPHSLCLIIHKLKAKKRHKGRPHVSPLLAHPQHPPTSAWLLGVQEATAQNPKFCRTRIHAHQLNKQERLPDKTKNQNAKSRACLKAVFLKIRLFPLFFTHC